MSTTIAAALKKIALAIVSEPKVLKTVIGIIIGIVIIICMPIAVILGISNGQVAIDPARLEELISENLPSEVQTELQLLEDTLQRIEQEMVTEGFSLQRAEEAKALYLLALSDHGTQHDFIPTLVSCFQGPQTDEELVAAVNETFGCCIQLEDFRNTMNSIHSTTSTEQEDSI